MEIIKKCPSEWSASDPILTTNQAGVDTDTDRVKFGDGENNWSVLPYTSYIEYAVNNGPYVSPEFFGEPSDNNDVDDTAIVQAALDSGKDVFFARDSYNISGTLYVPSNTRIYGNGSVLKVSPEAGGTITDVFSVGTKELNENCDIIKNVIFENLTFELSVPTSAVGLDETTTVSDGGNRCFISIYDNAENVVVKNCTFNGAACCVGMFETIGELCPVHVEALLRRNIVLKDIWATNVVECLVGETDVNGVYVDNIHIETVPTKIYNHAVRFNANVENIKINNFYIKGVKDKSSTENVIFGSPFSFYNHNSVTTIPCSQPIYLSNGEIHAANFGELTAPYEIFADNVNLINDDDYTSVQNHIFEHHGRSTGNYKNCTFDNCIKVRSGYYTNCFFTLAEGLDCLVDSTGARNNNKETERIVLQGCCVDVNNAAAFIALDEGIRAIDGVFYDVLIKSCTVKNSAYSTTENASDNTTESETSAEGKVVDIYSSDIPAHRIMISDSDFDEWFVEGFANEGCFNINENFGETFIVEFKRNSFKDGFVLSESEDADELNNVCLLCNAGDALI